MPTVSSPAAAATAPWSAASIEAALARAPYRALAAVLLLVGLTYLPTLNFDFVYDDGWTIVANGFLRAPRDLPRLWTGEAAALQVPDAFRPVSVAFDMLTYQTLGLRPGLHHAVSVTLHLGVCLVMFAWLGRLGAPAITRLCAVAIFGLLGLHAEPVSMISFREDLLAAGLGVSALLLADIATTARWQRAVPAALAAAGLLALGCGAKASAAVLPGLWLLAHALRPFGGAALPRRRIAMIAVVLAATVAGVVVFRQHTLGGLSPFGADNPAVFATRVGTSAVLAASAQIHLQYAWQLVVPTGLSPEHVDYGARWTDPATLLAVAALLLGTAFALTQWRRRPTLTFAVVGTLLLALPTSNLVGMPNMRADRFMYLPALPACVGLATGLWQLGRRRAARSGHPEWTLVPLVAFIVVQGAAARAASGAYRSDSRLWETGLRDEPASARAHAILGEQLMLRYVETGSTEPEILGRARSHCVLALIHDARDPLSWLCAGRVALQERAWTRAHRDFERALALAHQRRETIAAAIAEVTLARTDLPFETRARTALGQISEILEQAPYSSLVAATAATIHHQLGEPAEARDLYARASSLRPERWDLVARRVELELDLGHPAAAEAALRAVDPMTTVPDPTLHAALLRRLALAKRSWPDD
jgi:Tfp pilus assembly protein PilF